MLTRTPSSIDALVEGTFRARTKSIFDAKRLEGPGMDRLDEDRDIMLEVATNHPHANRADLEVAFWHAGGDASVFDDLYEEAQGV